MCETKRVSNREFKREGYTLCEYIQYICIIVYISKRHGFSFVYLKIPYIYINLKDST